VNNTCPAKPPMKVLFWFPLTLCLTFSLRAQTPDATYSSDQLDQLLGPIALYPDPLIAVILPASTVPSDITLAANYLAANGSPAGIDAQPWDPSVKALARYPDVVKWMNGNLDWTQALGAAFAQQPADVMKSVQQLRVQARAAGTLVDTPQQHVVLDGDNIRIVPAQPNTIYVPVYDPAIVYETPVGYAGPFITFGIGFPVGVWLGYQCDWDDFGIWMGPWSPGWAYSRGWRHPGIGGNAWRAWQPDPRRSRAVVRSFYRPEGRLPAPGFAAGYRAPVRLAGVALRPAVARAPSRPDYRGRAVAVPRPASPAPSSKFISGYNRGTQTRAFSTRGQVSRSAPVRTPPAPRAAAPARASAPARSAAPSRAPNQAPDDKRDRH
jgi:Protein of unknown function (DUF3300)